MLHNISQLQDRRRNNDSISKLLKSKGIKPTRLRINIASITLAKIHHLTVKQIRDELINRGYKLISDAEITITLREFCAHNLLREIFVHSMTVFYDSNTSCHAHFYNASTGELVNLPTSNINIYEIAPSQPRERLKVVTV